MPACRSNERGPNPSIGDDSGRKYTSCIMTEKPGRVEEEFLGKDAASSGGGAAGSSGVQGALQVVPQL